LLNIGHFHSDLILTQDNYCHFVNQWKYGILKRARKKFPSYEQGAHYIHFKNQNMFKTSKINNFHCVWTLISWKLTEQSKDSIWKWINFGTFLWSTAIYKWTFHCQSYIEIYNIEDAKKYIIRKAFIPNWFLIHTSINSKRCLAAA